MSNTPHDEATLIDLAMGQLEDPVKTELKDKISQDRALADAHRNVANTLAALQLLPEVEPSQDLISASLARIRQHHQTQQLLTHQEARRPLVFPTFSLRELGAVAAAVLIMSAVLLPALHSARQRATAGACMSQAGQIGSALMSYANANQDRLPSSGEEPRWLATPTSQASSNSSALFRLIRLRHAAPAVFQCPAGPGGSFSVTPELTDFPDARYVSYSYQHAVGPSSLRTNDPDLARVASQMAVLADRSPLFDARGFRRDRLGAKTSDNHDGRGQNVLYLDMHVQWANHPAVGVQGDHIFLADQIQDYSGAERPAGPTDTFLLPAWSAQR